MTKATTPSAKQALNGLDLDTLEALLAEEVEEQVLYDCGINWSCNINT